MSASKTSTTWTIGEIQLQRVPYFDIALSPESIDLEGIADSVDWAEPWLTDGQPTVGQAFWVIRADGQTVVVDPCGASDPFLRSGQGAVDHQTAAFDLLRAAEVEPESVDQVVLTHLDGIGMVALADGAPAGEETWTPAFPRADVVISQPEYDYISSGPVDLGGADAFTALDAAGVVRPVTVPYEISPGVTLRPTGKHSPGHCCVHIESGISRAVMIGHLAISPLHAAAGISANHQDPEGAWTEFRRVLDGAADDNALVTGSLWPLPGGARVTATDPYRLVPAPN